MVTKKDLLDDDKKRAAAERRRKKEADAEMTRWRAERLEKNKKRARDLVDGELGEFIKTMNAKGYKKIKIDSCRTWHPSKHWEWDENYGAPFVLDWEPKKECEATQILARKLQKAGFSAEVIVEQKQNYESYADYQGQAIRRVPGTHPEYAMIVSWED